MATTDVQGRAVAGTGGGAPFTWSMVLPMVRAGLFGFTGYFGAAWITAMLAHTVIVNPLPATIGYLVGLLGWVMGSGIWDG